MTTEEIAALSHHLDDKARFSPPCPRTYTSSVKVMRSYDYCHFEITLGSTEPLTVAGVDAMRKEAARLADKAVEQYKVAKHNAYQIELDHDRMARLRERAERIHKIAEPDRTPEQQAELKAYQDATFHPRRAYDYEDHWQEDTPEDLEDWELE